MTHFFFKLLFSLLFVSALGCGPPKVELTPPPLIPHTHDVFGVASQSLIQVHAGPRQGVGVLVDEDRVLTSYSLTQGALDLRLSLPGKAPFGAQLYAWDAKQDLALLSLEAPVETLYATPAMGAPKRGDQAWLLTTETAGSVYEAKIAGLDEAEIALDLNPMNPPLGAPLFCVGEQGQVELVAIARHTRTGESALLPINQASLDSLENTKRALSKPSDIIAHTTNLGPLVHQLVVAERIERGNQDIIMHPHDIVVVDQLPAHHTLHARSSWRYYLQGLHTYRYEVVRRSPEGDEVIHEGEKRRFELEDERAAFVHKISLDLILEKPGDHLLIVETDGQPTATFPFQVQEATPTTPEDTTPFTSPFNEWFTQEILIVAAKVEEGESGGLIIENTFNTITRPEGGAPVHFSTWARWGWGEPGAHEFQILLLDASGEPHASHQGSFELADSRAAFQHVARWEVSFDNPGLYFLVSTVNGQLSKSLPIWVY